MWSGDDLGRRRWLRRSLALMLLGGPALALLWLLIVGTDHPNSLGLVIVCVVAVAGGVALVLIPDRLLGDRLVQLTLAAMAVLVSAAIAFMGASGTPVILVYTWITPFAYLFFSAGQAALQTAWVGVCSAVTLLALDQPDAPMWQFTGRDPLRWLALMGTVVVIGIMVRRLTGWLHRSEERFSRGFEDSLLALAVMDANLVLLDANRALCTLLGVPRRALIGRPSTDFTHPDDRDLIERERRLVAEGGPSGGHAVLEKRMIRADGTVVPVAATTTAVQSPGERPVLFSQMEDISARVQHARQQEAIARLGQLALSEPDLRSLIGEAVAMLADILDADVCLGAELGSGGRRLQMVAAVGVDEELVLRHPLDRRRGTLIAATLASDEPIAIADFETENRFQIPRLLTEEGLCSGLTQRLAGSNGVPMGVVAAYWQRPRAWTPGEANFIHSLANVLSLAMERRRIDEEFRHAALHDPLTGLPNRALGLDHIELALGRSSREGTTVGVMVMDLNRFKLINDSLGHAAGDEVLLAVAPRLRAGLRPTDTVARLGGDEFVVVWESVDGPATAVMLAERLLDEVTRPVRLGRRELVVSASAGIALGTGDHDTPASLLRDADAAMYRAKERRLGGVELFDDHMRELADSRLRIETELRQAIDQGDLRVYYQPIVNVDTRQPYAVEALVRWERPGRGLVPPDEFIGVAEETGLITDLGRWVLEHAADDVAGWQQEFGWPLQLRVNVSARQLADPGFPAAVAEIARRSGLAEGTLGLEMTETVLLEEAESPASVLAHLREYDLRVVLDDFGTGYSSLSYLKRFPLDALKVDRSFVDGLGTDPDDSAIVEAVIRMAHTLELDVVAEGVETDEQLDQLRSLSCQRAQGFLFARPLPAEGLRQFLAQHLSAR